MPVVHVFEIPQSRLSRLSARAAKAAARARRSGLPVPSLAVSPAPSRVFEFRDPLARIRGADTDVRRASVPMVRVELRNFAPEIGEWKIVGYRSRSDRGRILESGEVPARMRGRDLCCEHCGYRRDRKETMVVRKSIGGDCVEVGSGCLEAFVGRGSGYVADLVEIGSILRGFEEAANADLSQEFLEEEVRIVLAVAFRRVCDDGFVSSSEAWAQGTTPTWRAVCDDLAACRRPDAREEDLRVTAADFMAADDIIDRYQAMGGNGGFVSSVRKAIARGVAGMKDVAVLTAAAGLHARDLRREAERRAAALGSEHVGRPGDRVEFVGRVRRVSQTISRYGELFFVTMLDADGNVMLWKTGRLRGLREGMAYEMRGTVKEHGTCEHGQYKGAAQTLLSRVAVVNEIGPADFSVEHVPERLSDEDEEALDMLLSASATL